MHFSDETERDFWMAAYLAAIRAGNSTEHAAIIADISVRHFRERPLVEIEHDPGEEPEPEFEPGSWPESGPGPAPSNSLTRLKDVRASLEDAPEYEPPAVTHLSDADYPGFGAP